MADNLEFAHNMYVNDPCYFIRFVQNQMLQRGMKPLRLYLNVNHKFISCTPIISGNILCDLTKREYVSLTDWYNAIHNKKMLITDKVILDKVYVPTYATIHQLFNTILTFEFDDITYRTFKFYNYVCNTIHNYQSDKSIHIVWKNIYHYTLNAIRLQPTISISGIPDSNTIIEEFESGRLSDIYVIDEITNEKIYIGIHKQPIQTSPSNQPYLIDTQSLIDDLLNRNILTTKQESLILWTHIQNLQNCVNTLHTTNTQNESRISMLENMLLTMFQTLPPLPPQNLNVIEDPFAATAAAAAVAAANTF